MSEIPRDEHGHATKADELALRLEDAIVSGELAPGSVLRQEQRRSATR